MRRSTIRTVEDILRDYPKIDKYIEQREQELRYPVTPVDENVGGGGMKFNVFEFASGEYLASLKQVNNQLRIVPTTDALAAQRFLSDSNLEKLGYLNGRLVTVEVKVD